MHLSRDFGANDLDCRLYDMVHLGDIQGRDLEVQHPVILSPQFCVIFRHLPTIFQIHFIPNQHRGVVALPVFRDVVILPVRDTLGFRTWDKKGVQISQIEQKETECLLPHYKGGDNVIALLLAGGIRDFQ